MGTSCTRLIDVDKLHFADNIRTPECLQLPAMIESLLRHGFKTNHPLVVSEKQIDGNTVYHVLVGNRRGLALCLLRGDNPDEYRRVLPTGKVPAVVHKGLTVEEEVEHRIDHSADEDRVPLDDCSIFLAIQQLVRVGLDTQETIARKLGLFKLRGKEKGQPNRSYVQVRINLARLPGFVQAEFKILFREGKDSTNVRLSDISGLYTLHTQEYPNYPESDGPLFTMAWELAKTPREQKADDSGTEAKELSPVEAVKRSQAAQSRGLKSAFLIVTKQSDENLAALDAVIVDGERALVTLQAIDKYLCSADYGFSTLELIEKAMAFVSDDSANRMEPIVDDSLPIEEEETVNA